jgi:hypothetical protein
LPQADRLRINKVVQILTDEVKAHYRWSQNQVESGFAEQTSNKFHMQQRLVAKAFTPEDMQMLGVACTAVTGGVSSHFSHELNGAWN